MEHVDDVERIYRQLLRGIGHEHVTDDNVQQLIRRAERDGHGVLATELREWSMPCTRDTDVPSTIAPTSGFNRDNAKH